MPTAFQKVRQTPMAAQAARHWQFSRKCSVPNKSGQSFHFRGRRNSQVQALAGSQKSKSLPQALAGNTTVPLYSSSTLAPAELELRTATPCITKPGGQLSILCFSDAFNTMSQRIALELATEHKVQVFVGATSEVERHRPDIIVAPFLTTRIPREVWSQLPCLIVHPGIRGDKGPNSIDWALKGRVGQWGVTVLQADEDWDAGHTWATQNFEVDIDALNLSKSSFYRSLCVPAAAVAVKSALQKLISGLPPLPLCEPMSAGEVQGTFNPKMTSQQRAADFHTMEASELLELMQISDTRPGMLHSFPGVPGKWFLFGGHLETPAASLQAISSQPDVKEGGILGHRDGAILVRCSRHTSVWVSHLKKLNTKEQSYIKLPATMALPTSVSESLHSIEAPEELCVLSFGEYPSSFHEIFVWKDSGVAFLHFNFYNGAMSTEQCHRLAAAVKSLGDDSNLSAVVLCGSPAFFSNGIHLNVIEASADPEAESWANITAMNEVVRSVLSIQGKVTVAAVLGNAGAGGAMLPLAADVVLAHEDVVFNPHYRRMQLHGSELWTTTLPAKVGSMKAKELTEQALPLLAKDAKLIGFVDDLIGGQRTAFWPMVKTFVHDLIQSERATHIVTAKGLERSADWWAEVEKRCEAELETMKHNFSDHKYHRARGNFVHKRKACTTTINISA